MSLNSNIILAGQQPDFVNVLARSNQAAQQKNQFNRENALNRLYQEQGAQIAAGDQNALNALAGFDPQAALGIQQGRQSMRINEEELSIRKQHAARQAAAWAQSQDDRTKAAEAEKIRQGLMTAGQFVAAGDQAGLDRVLQQYGLEPVPIEQFPYLAAQYEGVLEGLTAASQFGKPPEPDWMITDQGQAIDKTNPQRAINIEGYRTETPEPLTDAGKRVADQRNGYLDLDLPPEVDFDTEQKLRKEFLGIPAVKAFSEQAQAYERIVNSAKDPSPAGDLALIFNFMKVLDPGSVVRESEFATAAQAAAWLQESEELGVTIPQPIAIAIRKMATGQRLAPEQRQDFVGRARSLYEGAERGFVDLKQQYEGKARAYNLDPDRSLADFRFQEPEAAGQTPPAQQPQITFQTPEQRSVFEKYSQPQK